MKGLWSFRWIPHECKSGSHSSPLVGEHCPLYVSLALRLIFFVFAKWFYLTLKLHKWFLSENSLISLFLLKINRISSFELKAILYSFVLFFLKEFWRKMQVLVNKNFVEWSLWFSFSIRVICYLCMGNEIEVYICKTYYYVCLEAQFSLE